MKIAVASRDGTLVNEHFGRADRFLIYVITSNGPVKVGDVSVEPLSTGDKSHSFDADRFLGIATALKGCERVYVTKIGERPAAELKKIGMEAVVFEGEINSISR